MNYKKNTSMELNSCIFKILTLLGMHRGREVNAAINEVDNSSNDEWIDFNLEVDG